MEGSEETNEHDEEEDSGEGSGSSAPSSDAGMPLQQTHEADLCRCYLGHCMHVIQLHIALLSAAGYNNVTSANIGSMTSCVISQWQLHRQSERCLTHALSVSVVCPQC